MNQIYIVRLVDDASHLLPNIRVMANSRRSRSRSLFLYIVVRMSVQIYLRFVSSMKFILDSISRLAATTFVFLSTRAISHIIYIPFMRLYLKRFYAYPSVSRPRFILIKYIRVYFQSQNRSNRKIVIMLCACEWDSPVSTYDKYMWESAR